LVFVVSVVVVDDEADDVVAVVELELATFL
jgi:hypothetical protein